VMAINRGPRAKRPAIVKISQAQTIGGARER
jgi:hypothetical protein